MLVFNEQPLSVGGGGGRGGGGGFGGGGDAPTTNDLAANRGCRPRRCGRRPRALAGRAQAVARPAVAAAVQARRRACAPGDDRPPFQPEDPKYTRRRGSLSAEGLAAIKQFVMDGGTIIAIGTPPRARSALFDLPLTNHLVNASGAAPAHGLLRARLRAADGGRSEEPGRARLRRSGGHLLRERPGLEARPERRRRRTCARSRWFNTPEPLRSGWAWGQKYLDKGIQMAEANVGQGRVFLFGNEVLFRTQPHGTYKFFFNAIYLSVAPTMKAGVGQ